MNISIISFTENGMHLSEKIAKQLGETECLLFTKCSAYFNEKKEQSIEFAKEKVDEWAKRQMEKQNALLFVGACGIAVRAIAPHLTNKLQDKPVLVIDEDGKYVIPILSGHIGGANELAIFIAKKIGGEPVITTATDIRGKFAVDLFAKKNRLFIVNKEGIAKVSSKVLSGETIVISVEPGHGEDAWRMPEGIHMVEYPTKKQVDIVITSEKQEFEASICLKPKEYIVGIGCKRGKEAEKIETFILQSMKKIGIHTTQIATIASIDLKNNEQGILVWSKREEIPFVTFSAEELQKVKGKFHKSNFVKEKVNVDNVCERAALKAAEPNGKLVYEKHAEDGMTIAIAKREWRVDFDEI